jgi:hypothetical protein
LTLKEDHFNSLLTRCEDREQFKRIFHIKYSFVTYFLKCENKGIDKMASELDILLAFGSVVVLILVAVSIAAYTSYKEYKKEKKIDYTSIVSVTIAIIITVIIISSFTWDILMNTLNNLDPTDIDGAGRAVNGFIVVNFIVLGLTFAISHSIIGKIIRKP